MFSDMACVVGFDHKVEKKFRWIVVFRRYKNFHNETYGFVVVSDDANVISLLDAIRPMFVDPEKGEFCTACLYGGGRFLKCYIILHDNGQGNLAACLCPMEAPVELTGKGSMYYDSFSRRGS